MMHSVNVSIVLITVLCLQVDDLLIQQGFRQCDVQNNWTCHHNIQMTSGSDQVIGPKGK